MNKFVTAPKRGTKGKQRSAVSSTSKSAASKTIEAPHCPNCDRHAANLADQILKRFCLEEKLTSSRAELAAKEASLNASLAQAQQQFDTREIELGAHLTRLISEHVALRREIEGLKAERDRAVKDAGDWAINHENEKRRADGLAQKNDGLLAWCVTLVLLAVLCAAMGNSIGHRKADRWYAAHPAVESAIPGDTGADFFSKDGGRTCVILVPPSHELALFGKVSIRPSTNGPALNPDPRTQAYNCEFGGKP